MNKRILIIGSTGKLGSELLKYSSKHELDIFALCCFKNKNKLKLQKQKFKTKHNFVLSNLDDRNLFKNFLKTYKIKYIYFLDYSFKSLEFVDIILKYNFHSHLCIANKELIICGGRTLINKIIKSKNYFFPLDSEHFSLLKSNITNDNISNVYITASGGPFYTKKNINLNNVSLNNVLNHPKWDMGVNNTIDSSNFVNKFLEMIELSTIFDINPNKIDFVVSPNTFIHSFINFKDGTTSFNCFKNKMIIPLISPLRGSYCLPSINNNNYVFENDNFKIYKFSDKRFKIGKYLNFLKELSHSEIILFLILNNIAHKKYLSGNLKYNEIINFIIINLRKKREDKYLKTIYDIIKYTNNLSDQLNNEL